MIQRLLPVAALAAFAPAQTPCHDLAGLDPIAQQALASLNLTGLVLRVDQGGQPVYAQIFGGHAPNEVMPLASASKTMSVALLMTLVDEGRLRLDDPVGLWLPEFATGPLAAITVRMCFAHTSGLPTLDPATRDPAITLRQAAQQIAQLPLEYPPGSMFGYGNVSMQVGGAVCEVVGGLPWSQLFQQRIAGPLGMVSTDYFAFGPTQNPPVADGARSSAPDYANFLEMLRTGGVFQGTRILSAVAVDEMLRDQMSHLPVRATPHPAHKPCGLGLWIERQDALGRTALVSMPGAFGFYGWLDRVRDSAGVWLATTFYVFAYPFVERCWAVTDLGLSPLGVQCSGSASPACAPPPRLNATTWVRAGQPDFGFRVEAAPPGSYGGVSLAFGPPTAGVPLLGITGYLPPGATTFAAMGTDPGGRASLAVPLPPVVQGLTFSLQGFWFDLGGCNPSGLLASRALRLDVLAP